MRAFFLLINLPWGTSPKWDAEQSMPCFCPWLLQWGFVLRRQVLTNARNANVQLGWPAAQLDYLLHNQ